MCVEDASGSTRGEEVEVGFLVVEGKVPPKKKYWTVWRKVQFIQNFSSQNSTSPREARKTMLRMLPVPLEGKRLRLAFWWLRPIRKRKNSTTITTHTNPVKRAGGSILWAGASVIMMDGVV